MSNALGAVLQGLDRGAGMGLNMYQALNNEARAKRQEQFQRNRAAREDFVSDRAHNTQMERYKVEDDHWGKIYKATIRGLDQKDTEIENARVHNAGMRGIYQGQLTLGRDKFNEDREATRRTRAMEQIQRMNQSLGYGEDGRVLSGEEFNERLRESGQAGTYMALHGYVNGMYSFDRLMKYDDAQGVPVSDTDMAVGVTSATGEWEGVKPATVEGSSREDDPVMVGNPYDMFLQSLSSEQHLEARAQGRDDALIDIDSQGQIDAFEESYQRQVQSFDAQQEAMEKQLEESRAKLSELEANRIPVPASRLSEEELAVARLTGGGLFGSGKGWTTRNSAKGHAWEADYAKATEALEQAQRFLDAAPNRREQLEGIRTSSLADIAAQAERDRIEPGYTERRRDRQVKATEAAKADIEAGNKVIDNAVKAQNAHGEKVFGKDFKKYLNPNEVRTEFGRLHPDVRRRIVASPGGLEAAVTVMGSLGVTSFDYIIDAMESQVNMDSYKKALQDPALVSVTGGNADEMHVVAKAFAEHMARHPKAPTNSVLLALSQGKEPPKGK